ncbi:MAG: hypothetical protein ABIJ27_01710 [Candidatus Omnitrophota bacterium]
MRVLVLVACVAAASFYMKKNKPSGTETTGTRRKVTVRKSADVLGKGVTSEKKITPQGDLLLYDFESDRLDWEIPEWAADQEDHVAISLNRSQNYAKSGKHSLKVMAEFPGKTWTAALIESERFYDWGPYSWISCYIYLPEDAPKGLKARFVLTVGKEWKFTEMNRAIYLVPGEWNLVTANLLPGSGDWKMISVDDDFRKDIRKLDVRIESNKKPEYSGAVYIDDIKLSGK